jgi:hypothetical protein
MNDVRLVATNPDDNTLVPVASNSSGQLAVQSPKIEKVPNDFDVEGDLTVTGGDLTVTGGDLTVTGSATFAGEIGIGGTLPAAPNISLHADGKVDCKKVDVNTTNFTAGNQRLDGLVIANSTADARLGHYTTANGTPASFYSQTTGGAPFHFKMGNTTRMAILSSGSIHIGGSLNEPTAASPSIMLNADGKASFKGDVVVASRNEKQYMLVESGGLCHMVEQTRVSTSDLVSEYPRLRDVFAELDVVEKALEQVMEKLRMVEPDGWPVWDGSSNT